MTSPYEQQPDIDIAVMVAQQLASRNYPQNDEVVNALIVPSEWQLLQAQKAREKAEEERLKRLAEEGLFQALHSDAIRVAHAATHVPTEKCRPAQLPPGWFLHAGYRPYKIIFGDYMSTTGDLYTAQTKPSSRQLRTQTPPKKVLSKQAAIESITQRIDEVSYGRIRHYLARFSVNHLLNL